MIVEGIPLHPDVSYYAQRYLTAAHHHLASCTLAVNTVKAYRRQTSAYIAWLVVHAADYPDALGDLVGAQAAVTAWRRHLLRSRKFRPATVNQAPAAVTVLYAHGPRLRIAVNRVRAPRPGEPEVLMAAAVSGGLAGVIRTRRWPAPYASNSMGRPGVADSGLPARPAMPVSGACRWGAPSTNDIGGQARARTRPALSPSGVDGENPSLLHG